MSIGSFGRTDRQRVSDEERQLADYQLSRRHRKWGDDCPAVDLDFLLCEYYHGVGVAVVDYKHHRANPYKTNTKSFETLSGLYDKQGRQIPFFIARYWPDIWAFRLKAVNEAAVSALLEIGRRSAPDDLPEWLDLDEQSYVRTLYLIRKRALNRGDERTIATLNTIKPPIEAGAA